MFDLKAYHRTHTTLSTGQVLSAAQNNSPQRKRRKKVENGPKNEWKEIIS